MHSPEEFPICLLARLEGRLREALPIFIVTIFLHGFFGRGRRPRDFKCRRVVEPALDAVFSERTSEEEGVDKVATGGVFSTINGVAATLASACFSISMRSAVAGEASVFGSLSFDGEGGVALWLALPLR